MTLTFNNKSQTSKIKKKKLRTPTNKKYIYKKEFIMPVPERNKRENEIL